MPRKARPAVGPLTQSAAAILRGELASRQITRTFLADATGISTSQISDILLAHKHVSLDDLGRICGALNLSLVEFVAQAQMRSSDLHVGRDAH